MDGLRAGRGPAPTSSNKARNRHRQGTPNVAAVRDPQITAKPTCLLGRASSRSEEAMCRRSRHARSLIHIRIAGSLYERMY